MMQIEVRKAVVIATSDNVNSQRDFSLRLSLRHHFLCRRGFASCRDGDRLTDPAPLFIFSVCSRQESC